MVAREGGCLRQALPPGLSCAAESAGLGAGLLSYPILSYPILSYSILFYNAFVLSALLYCYCCTWSPTAAQLDRRLEVLHNSCLRRIKGLPPRPSDTSTDDLHTAGSDQGGPPTQLLLGFTSIA